MNQNTLPSLQELRQRCMISDQRRLWRKVIDLEKKVPPERREAQTESIQQAFNEAQARLTERQALRPQIRYPESLPVSQRAEEISALITANQVVIVAGETGSGKTTQLPKICLEAGLGRFGMIGHTQPRRLAARAVSSRLAEELQVRKWVFRCGLLIR